MTATDLTAEYRKARRHAWNEPPTPAAQAMRAARYALTDPEAEAGIEWDSDRYSGNLTADVERDGFTVTVEVKPDEGYYDDDVFGTFDDVAGRWPETMPSGSTDWHAYKYYHPAEPTARFDWYRRMGASKATAYDWLRRALDDEVRYARERFPYYAIATARRHGIELGSASLGGLEYSDEESSERQAAAFIAESGLIDEAIAEARKALAALTEEVPA